MNLQPSDPLEETHDADDSRQWRLEKSGLIARHDGEILALKEALNAREVELRQSHAELTQSHAELAQHKAELALLKVQLETLRRLKFGRSTEPVRSGAAAIV